MGYQVTQKLHTQAMTFCNQPKTSSSLFNKPPTQERKFNISFQGLITVLEIFTESRVEQDLICKHCTKNEVFHSMESFLWIWSNLLNKSLMENLIF